MIKHILITAAALAVATVVLPGITVAKPWWYQGVLTLLGVAIIFGIINAIIKPLFKSLGGCIIMITFGLALLVINALMMLATSWVCGVLGIGWHIGGKDWIDTFIIALEGSLIVSIISFLGAKLFNDKRSRQ